MQTINYDGFAAHLLRSGRRNTTVRKHLNCLKYLDKKQIPFDKTSLENFLTSLKADNKKGSYLNMFVFALRLYGAFIGEDLRLKEFKREMTFVSTLSDDETEKFLLLPRRKNEPFEHHRRFKMFWSIVAFTGLRPGECAVLKPKHFDFGRGVIVIETSKTNTPGIVPIPPNITPDINQFIERLAADDWLFPSARGGDSYQCGIPVIDNVAWHFDWTRRIKILGLKRFGLRPYSFRHTYGTRALEENYDNYLIVKKLMRHKDLKSTLVYEHYTTKDIKQAQGNMPLISMGIDPREKIKRWSKILRDLRVGDDNRFKFELVEDGTSIRFECNILEDITQE